MKKLQALSRFLLSNIELRSRQSRHQKNEEPCLYKQVVIYEVSGVAIAFLTSCTEMGPEV
jgi:hypothetical protein